MNGFLDYNFISVALKFKFYVQTQKLY